MYRIHIASNLFSTSTTTTTTTTSTMISIMIFMFFFFIMIFMFFFFMMIIMMMMTFFCNQCFNFFMNWLNFLCNFSIWCYYFMYFLIYWFFYIMFQVMWFIWSIGKRKEKKIESKSLWNLNIFTFRMWYFMWSTSIFMMLINWKMWWFWFKCHMYWYSMCFD